MIDRYIVALSTYASEIDDLILLIGVLVGTYSSMFIASTALIARSTIIAMRDIST